MPTFASLLLIPKIDDFKQKTLINASRCILNVSTCCTTNTSGLKSYELEQGRLHTEGCTLPTSDSDISLHKIITIKAL
jgi:hypothetical protein